MGATNLMKGGYRTMVAVLLLLLLMILLFGGLGIFVAKWFFILLIASLLVSLFTGGVYVRR
jgi:hypothetical protein